MQLRKIVLNQYTKNSFTSEANICKFGEPASRMKSSGNFDRKEEE